MLVVLATEVVTVVVGGMFAGSGGGIGRVNAGSVGRNGFISRQFSAFLAFELKPQWTAAFVSYVRMYLIFFCLQ